ncbi:hypothetical protein SAMN04488519_10768 [Algoriphagus ornithinivorans]|uniref:SGNH/GDSL hydrolase family protein n=1 Tax=Algoriphagus ornithinivorans TaxID=226506 RepID=A0A1I5HID8_9BACT|nr:hypothetical protein [Algoriphagus ornithinivorans]SFO48098.1 hypothetical protein SAMN04488519_10768 [Algoriphagus ornithinivorans]
MIKFISRIFLFSVFPIASLFGVFLLENGTADPFYQRFVTPKQEALILGNSKAAQGIIPSIINDRLADIYPANLYNYSFTVYNSPFGPAYLESIKMKLADYDGKRCFIITVDPWSISSDINDPNNPEKFEENKLFLSGIKNVSSKPNLEYFFLWFDNPFYEIILMRMINQVSKLHSDGWYETSGNMNENAVKSRRLFMIDLYTDFLKKYSYSAERFKYLQKTIDFLQTRGKVFLVRMPLHQNLLTIEQNLDPDFGLRMGFLSQKFGVQYFDFNNSEMNWEFKDGLHMTVESAKNLSKILSNKILLSEN